MVYTIATVAAKDLKATLDAVDAAPRTLVSVVFTSTNKFVVISKA